MRKKLLLMAVYLWGVTFLPEARTQNLQKESKITYLEQDSFYNFYFAHDVKVNSEFDAEQKLWKVKLEEVCNRKSLSVPHIEVLWLKLDDNCRPKSWDLQNFSINGHRFVVYLLKKKTNKKTY